MPFLHLDSCRSRDQSEQAGDISQLLQYTKGYHFHIPQKKDKIVSCDVTFMNETKGSCQLDHDDCDKRANDYPWMKSIREFGSANQL